MRKLPRTWHIGGAVVIVFLAFVVMIVPVFIFPLFNKITRLDDPKNHAAYPFDGARQRDSGPGRFPD